jgi:hypothetical protein
MTDRSELAKHVQDVVESREAASQGGPAASNGSEASRKRAIRFLIIGWVLIAWIWLARPAFLFEAEDAELGEANREASLRFGMVLQKNAIDEYTEANGGRLPERWSELGEPDEDIEVERAGGGYVITATAGELTLRLTDAMDADSFLGDALQLLQSRR